MPKNTPSAPSPRSSSAPRASRPPKYTLHKPSGQARVRLDGRDIYLGPHGSPQSHEAYDRAIAEWLSGGPKLGRFPGELAPERTTVRELSEAYLQHRSRSRVSSHVVSKVDQPALKRLTALYGSTRACEFTPACARALMRRAIVDEELSRQYINGKVLPVIKRAFRWGVREGIVPTSIMTRLAACEPIAYGEYGARETEPVRAVDEETVSRTLKVLPPMIRDMVRLQLLTGMRPGELCGIRWAEIDTASPCWAYLPANHKNKHRRQSRTIGIGPKGQAILMRYGDRPDDQPIFSPQRSEEGRRAQLRASRQSKPTPSQLSRDKTREAHRNCGKRSPGTAYTPASFARAIRRACERHGIPHWTPNQLRHTRATQLRRKYGLDGAGAVLGHARLETTQIYAERAVELAERISLETG